MSQIKPNVIGRLIQAAGASLVGFQQAGAGSVLRTLQSRLQDQINVKDFGAVGDGATDDTAAMQAAHNTGLVVYYPAANYKFSSISMAAGGIRGDGPGKTVLVSSDATSGNVITFTGTGGAGAVPVFENFLITAGAVKAAGAALKITPSSGELQYLNLFNVAVYGFPRSYHLTSATYGGMTRCMGINYTDAGVYYEDTFNNGAGDFVIQGCHFNTGQPSGLRVGIWQQSGGGLRIIGNKILGGATGFTLNYTSAIASGPLLITGNSIENCINFGIYLGTASTGTFGAIAIVGNEIAQISGASGCGISSDTNGKISQLTIVGNHIAFNGATGTGIALNTVAGFEISGNTIVGNSQAGNIGITTTAGCTNGKIGQQAYVGFIAAAATISNGSGQVFVQGDTQTGTVASINCATTYGPLFYGSASVVFPVPFSQIPVVHCNAGGAAGVAAGFGGYATNVTKTGFTYNLVSVASGATASNLWDAQGVI